MGENLVYLRSRAENGVMVECELYRWTAPQFVPKPLLVLFAWEIKVPVVAFMCFVLLFPKHLAKGRHTTMNRHLLMGMCTMGGLEECFEIPRRKTYSGLE